MRSAKKTFDPVRTDVSASKLKFWRTNLFSDVFLENDLGRHFKAWSDDDHLDPAFQRLVNYAHDSVDLEDFRARNENDTVKIIEEILQILGWCDSDKERRDIILSETVFHEKVIVIKEGTESVVKRAYRPDVLILDKPGQRKSVNPSRGVYDLDAAARFALVPLEIKYWGRLAAEETNGKYKVDKTKDNDKDRLSLKPNQQIQKYMKILKKDWGILTDGATWRLFNLNESNGEDVFFEFRFDIWIEEVQRNLLSKTDNNPRHLFEGFKFFHFFFGRESFTLKRTGFIDQVFQETQKYVRDLDKEFSAPFIDAMTIACNAYRKAVGSAAAKQNRNLILNVCESHIFNILFIRSCETSGVLKSKEPPYSNHCLESLIEAVAAFNPSHGTDNIEELDESFKDFYDHGYDFDPNGDDLYRRLLKTYEIVRGGSGKDFVGFEESFFDTEQKSFIEKHSIKNDDFVRILFTLNYDRESSYVDRDGKRRFRQFAFNVIKPRQLGSVYESFLEYDLKIADTDVAFVKGTWTPQDLNSRKFIELKKSTKKAIPVSPKGAFYFEHAHVNLRKQSGSYYTPDFIVQNIVKEVLAPLTMGRSSKELLNLRICDPSMGSGHFLVEVMKQLADAYEDAYAREHNDYIDSDRRVVLRRVLEGSIFGVDINPRAVKLGKMSLWLATAYPGKKLEHLDDQLKCGNSLIDDSKIDSRAIGWEKAFGRKFSAIVGNPPYVNIVRIEPKELRKALFEKYTVALNKCDLYSFFIERSEDLLEEGGRLGFVVSNSWIGSQSFRKLREFLLNEVSVESLTELPKNVFPGVSVSALVLVLEKRKPAPRHSVKLRRFDVDGVVDVGHSLEYSTIRSTASLAFGFDRITEFTVPTVKLGDIAEFSLGVKTADDQTFIVGTKKDRSCYPMIRGRSVSRYLVSPSTEWLWYRPDLMAKRVGSRPRVLENFLREKIVIVDVAKEIVAALDTKKHLCNDKLSFIYAVKDFDMRFVLAVLNSKPANDWYCSHNPEGLGVKVGQLRELPIPKIDLKNKSAAKSYRRIITLVDQIHGSHAGDCKSAKDEIDQLVADLYGLSFAEESAA